MTLSRHVRRWLALTAAATLLAASAGCASSATAAVTPPTPSGRVAALCRSLHGALPQVVDGLKRRATGPASPYTAAWGDPAVVLRCGTAAPAMLTPGNAHYNPEADAAEVNGVSWLIEQESGGAYRFTTTDREAWIVVDVPSAYAPQVNPLTDLAAAINRTVPTTVDPGSGTR